MVEAVPNNGLFGTMPAQLRPYMATDADTVASLVGPTLEALYPNGEAWLNQKLDDIGTGNAICTLAEFGTKPVGLTIETLKGPGRRKLSTIWVHESMRGHGVGTQLARACLQDWRDSHLNEVRVTARLRVADSIARLLVPVGFAYRALEHNRYGTGQHELVLVWTPDSDKAAADLEWVKETLSEIERRLVSPEV